MKLNILSKKNKALLLMALLGALCLASACERNNIINREHVAIVNGEKIYLDEYSQRLNAQKDMLSPDIFPNALDKQKLLEEEILDSLITEKIVLQRARELKLSVSNDELDKKISNIRKNYGDNFFEQFRTHDIHYEDWREELKKEMLMDKLIAADVYASISISENELEDFFHLHPNICRDEKSVRAMQIFVRDLAKAKTIRERLINDENFASVAAQESLGPEASRGGDLGLIEQRTMPAPIDQAIFQLQKGQISPIVKSAYGYHIFKITEIYPAKTKTFSECRNNLTAALREYKEDAAFAVWLDALKLKALIKREAKALSKNPATKSVQGDKI